jgi:prepilin-type processing-associated H-X9-DG protein
MQARLQRDSACSRHGLALIETVVLIVVVVLLAAFILPALNHTTGGSRSLQCLSNIRQVALAIKTKAALDNMRAPYLASDGETSWVREILLDVDGGTIHRNIETAEAQNARISVLVCPENAVNRADQGLSYKANAGSRAFSTEKLRHMSGVMIPKGRTAAPGVRALRSYGDRVSFDDVSRGDGVSNTILLSETTSRGKWYSGANASWGTPGGNHTQLGTQFKPTGRNMAFTAASARGLPNSSHTGVTNVVFCDGSGKALSISSTSGPAERLVMGRLMTWRGSLTSPAEPPLGNIKQYFGN